MADLHQLSTAELAALYRSRKASPVEAVRAVIAHIERYEPKLQALYAYDPEAALAQARASEARWADGKPLSAKPHLRRLAASAAELYGLPLDVDALLADASAEALPIGPSGRMRVEILPTGSTSISARPIDPGATFPLARLALVDPIVIPGGLGAHNSPVVTCPASLSVLQGTGGTAAISSADPDGTVTSLTVGSVTPAPATGKAEPPPPPGLTPTSTLRDHRQPPPSVI